MASEPSVCFVTETKDAKVKDSLALVDLEDLDDKEESAESALVSPRDLTRINFRSLIGHTDEVNTCAFSPDWSKIVTGGDDMLVKLWDSRTGKVLFTIDSHGGAIKCVCFSSDGSLFASASYDHTVRVMDTVTGKEVFCLEGHTHSVETCCFSPNLRYLCSGSWDNSAVVWNLKVCRQTSASCFSLAPPRSQGSLLLGGRVGEDPGIKTGTAAFVLNGHRNVVQACAFSSDSTTVASGSWDCTVRLWPLGNDKVDTKCLKGHKSNIHAVAFSSTGILASASWDCTLRLWSTELGHLLHVLQGHTGWVQACSFSADGKLLASASDDQTVRVWDTETAQCVKELECNTDEIHTCCFTPTGSLFASGPAEAETTICIY